MRKSKDFTWSEDWFSCYFERVIEINFPTTTTGLSSLDRLPHHYYYYQFTTPTIIIITQMKRSDVGRLKRVTSNIIDFVAELAEHFPMTLPPSSPSYSSKRDPSYVKSGEIMSL